MHDFCFDHKLIFPSFTNTSLTQILTKTWVYTYIVSTGAAASPARPARGRRLPGPGPDPGPAPAACMQGWTWKCTSPWCLRDRRLEIPDSQTWFQCQGSPCEDVQSYTAAGRASPLCLGDVFKSKTCLCCIQRGVCTSHTRSENVCMLQRRNDG